MRSRADAAPVHLYVPELAGAGASVLLSPEESRYLTRVCRARVGDGATATDGAGTTAALRVAALGERVRAAVEQRAAEPRAARAWVLCGAPEGERADWLVEKLAELGIERWQPVECARAGFARAGGRAERWRRLAVAGMRQSRRAHLMEVAEPLPLAGALAALPAGSDRWRAAAGGARPPAPDRTRLQVAAIGPAPGFTGAESAALEAAGFAAVALSDARLRTETAALAWAAWWSAG